MGFTGERIVSIGYVELRLIMGSPPLPKTVKVKFLVVDFPLAYNAIIGRSTLNVLRVIMSIPHLTMKFITEERKVYTVIGDQAEAKKCYKFSINTPKVVGSTMNISLGKEKNAH